MLCFDTPVSDNTRLTVATTILKITARVHDLRHTFAVHRLIQWYEEGADLNAKLPLLVTYLGHQDFTGTQKYLHLTAELFPNLTERMNKQYGGVLCTRQKFN